MCFIYACKHTSFFLTTIHLAHFFCRGGEKSTIRPSFSCYGSGRSPRHFPILTQFKEDLHADIPLLAKDDKVRHILYPKPGEDSIAVAIFVLSPAGFA